MRFLRRTYPAQLANYSGHHLPDAIDLITAELATPTPAESNRLSRRRRRNRRRHWKEADFRAFCRQQATATHDARLPSPDRRGGTPAEFWRKRRKTGHRRRRQQPGGRSRLQRLSSVRADGSWDPKRLA